MNTSKGLRDEISAIFYLYDIGAYDELRALAVLHAADGVRLSLTAHRIEAANDAAEERAARAEAERDKLSAELRDARVIAEEAAGLRVALDEARARVEAIAVERNAIVSELSQATDAMMAARAERDEARARPTYEARTVAPTDAEIAAHLRPAGGCWLAIGNGSSQVVHLRGVRDIPVWPETWIALGRNRLPCAWPEVSE